MLLASSLGARQVYLSSHWLALVRVASLKGTSIVVGRHVLITHTHVSLADCNLLLRAYPFATHLVVDVLAVSHVCVGVAGSNAELQQSLSERGVR